MYRNSYALVNKSSLKDNIREIKEKYPDYEYYFGVVKNNCYHHGIGAVEALLAGGINYLCVSSLDEGMQIREKYSSIPILVLEPIDSQYISVAIENKITITVDALDFVKELVSMRLKDKLLIHIKLDTGMNRLGFKDKNDLEEAYSLLKESKHIVVEGIYTHFATSGRGDIFYERQLKCLEDLLSAIPYEEIPIRHFDRSITFVSHKKITFANGIRLGIMMYGFNESVRVNTRGLKKILRKVKRNMLLKKGLIHEYTTENNLQLNTAYSLYSSIISVRPVKVGEFVGYNASYQVLDDGYIATIQIGYADGVTKEFGIVVIDGEYYPIVADTMDMIMIFSKKSLKVGSLVEIIGPNRSVRDVARALGTNSYHLFTRITSRVPIIYEELENEKE